ncbi:serine/threonine protein kinase [Melittangium boletus]|uniref:Protein kinase n=1 Tax=Melittangium boletus DSM 14713 TaxID=1294270 RepID=A0A250I813_9BACT|nr:serine/threonine-protein kinase [Melittangium boletus]ATB27267.1 protein kinase [Melittangium boletus DSM 14713]
MNPQIFGKYQLIKKLATGGMAEVWLARQRGIEGFAKNVVVKRILPHLAEDREFVEMFRNEALIAAKFNHPNIAQVYEFGEANGTYFIAMEYIHGEDLGRVLRKAFNAGGWIAQPLAIRIVAAACEGLYYAHTRTDDAGRPLKVVHRDISPQNILISFDGSVKLVDFGIAKAADQASMTKSGAIKGKFAYMAPEQAAGKALDHRADIFAIGLVLYEMLTSERPLKRDMELATLQAALECNIPPPSQVADVPRELDSVVMRALAKAADDRYRDARQLQTSLEEFLVSQRWVAGSVQISELMEALFADRLEEEKRSGNPEPRSEGESVTASPAVPEFSPEEERPSARGASRNEPRASLTSAGKDVAWEAPPGEMQSSPRRTVVRQALKRTESSTIPMTDLEEEEWQAPQSTEVAPRRRTGQESPRRSLTSAPPVRQPSRVDVNRGGSPESGALRRPGSDSSSSVPRRTGIRPSEVAQDEAPRPSRAAMALRPRPVEDEEEDPERTMLPPPEPEPVRRRTGMAAQVAPPLSDSGVRRRTSSRAEMAEAPPIRRRTSALAKAPPPDEDSSPSIKLPVAAPPRRRSLPLGTVFGLVMIVALLAGGVLFRKPLMDMLSSTAMDGQGIFISLKTSTPVEVSVKHNSRCRSDAPITALGRTPLNNVSGAHLQDTLILENKQMGIHKEIEVPFGEPNEHKTLPDVEFKMGQVRLKLLPRTVSGVEIFRDGQKLGLYQPGLLFDLMEGTHHLVLQSPMLKEEILVDVDVKAHSIVEKEVNVSKLIQ